MDNRTRIETPDSTAVESIGFVGGNDLEVVYRSGARWLYVGIEAADRAAVEAAAAGEASLGAVINRRIRARYAGAQI